MPLISLMDHAKAFIFFLSICNNLVSIFSLKAEEMIMGFMPLLLENAYQTAL